METENFDHYATVTSFASRTLPVPIMAGDKNSTTGTTGFLKLSPNTTPTNASPVVTPKSGNSPNSENLMMTADHKFFDQYLGRKLMEDKPQLAPLTGVAGGGCRPPGGTFRNFYNGLDTIPEYQVSIFSREHGVLRRL
jgi:hypothetical protein